MKRIFIALLIGLSFGGQTCLANHVLIVVGPDNHGPGSHEPVAGARLLKYCVETAKNPAGHTAEVVTQWPSHKQQMMADTVVFLGDTFPANRFEDPARNLADLHRMMKRGCGIVCIHYATGLKKGDVSSTGEHPLLGWMGGYFANPGSTHHVSYARVFDEARITPTKTSHPVLRGWKEFVVRDEPYGNNYFGPSDNKPAPNVTILATSQQPPEKPQREAVAWCVQRADDGRGFGIVMPHFYKNWSNEDLRRFVLNGIVWTAGVEVPADGVNSKLPDLKAFGPKSVEAK